MKEILVTIKSDTQKGHLKLALMCDKRYMGRAIHQDRIDDPEIRNTLRELGLMKGDRLDPQDALEDTHNFEALPLPIIDLKFWRTSIEGRVQHHSPIWDIYGFSGDNICVDTLHAMDKGMLPRVYGCIFWKVHKERFLLSASLASFLNENMRQQTTLDALKGHVFSSG